MADDFFSSIMKKITGAEGAVAPQAPPSEISGTTGFSQLDSLEQIQESKNKTVPGSPQLPIGGGDIFNPDQFQKLYDTTVSSVVSFITDQMGKTVEEQKEIQREELMRRIRLGIENFFSSAAMADGSLKQNDSAYELMVMSSVASMLMLSAAAIGQVQIPLVQGLEMVPVSLQSLAFVTETFIGAGLVVPLLGSFAAETVANPKVADEADVPGAYAMRVAWGVQSGAIGKLIDTLFAGQPEELLAKLKEGMELSFLFRSLVALYRNETGWINPEEIASLISGGAVYQGIKKENGSDPRLILADLIRERLRHLSKEDREAFIVTHLAKASDTSDVGDVQGSVKMLSNIWANFDYEQVSSNPV